MTIREAAEKYARENCGECPSEKTPYELAYEAFKNGALFGVGENENIGRVIQYDSMLFKDRHKKIKALIEEIIRILG